MVLTKAGKTMVLRLNMASSGEPRFVSNAGRLLHHLADGKADSESVNSGRVILTAETARETGAPFRAAIVTDYETCRAVLRDDERFSSHQAPFGHLANPAFPGGAIAPGTILRYDGEAHRRLRASVLADFTARAAERDDELFRKTANETLDELGGVEATELISTYAARVPALVTCDLMGLPRHTWDDVAAWCFAVNDLSSLPESRALADERICALLRALLEDTSEGLLGHIVELCRLERLTLDEAIMLSSTLLVAGIETTANAIGLALEWLIANPDEGEALRENCGQLTEACEELLRYQTVVRYGVARVARVPVTIGEYHLEPGTVVIPSLWHANRDSRFLSDGERLDIARRRTRHLSFGHGAHQCLGQHVARAELNAALHAFVERVRGARLAPGCLPQMRTSTVYGPQTLYVEWEGVAANWSCQRSSA